MKIERIARERCPAARFIGKCYQGPANWSEWWENGWFDILDSLPGALQINDHAYIEIIRIAGGKEEHWLGMFFSQDCEVPGGFDSVDLPPMEYAVCYLYGSPESGELFGLEAHNHCLAALREQGLHRKEGDWCFQRCNCPRFTTPDEQGNVVLDYGLSVEAEDIS